jgi:O-antigen ligase
MWKAMIVSQMKLRRRELWILIHGIACFILALSLVLTRSRAGFISTAVGALVFVIVFTYGNKPQWLAARPKLFGAALLAIVSGTLSLFFLFGGITIERISEQGIEDSARWCTYASTVRAILDNFWLGTGFGTFEDVFPLYRDPSCSGIMGLWDRAHNSYLEFVLGTGLIGLVFLTALLTNLGRVLLTGIRNRRRFRFAPAAGIAILTTVAAHALVDFSIQIQGFAVFCSSALAASVLFSTNDRVSHHLR